MNEDEKRKWFKAPEEPPECLNDPTGHKLGAPRNYCWDTDLPFDEWCYVCQTYQPEED